MPVIINGSTGISGTDGSAGTPALQGTDANTGMFFPAADQIAFAEGGVEAMRLDALGRVGIGTSSPGALLDVTVPGGFLAQQWVGTSGVYHRIGTATTSFYTVHNGSTDTFLYTQEAAALRFGTGATERGRFTATGDFQFNSGYGSVATAFGCRAWVNFNGTGTVAIRASGNVSSITDLGVGRYRVNFSTAMPNADFSAVASCNAFASGTYTFNTAYVDVFTNDASNSGGQDASIVSVAVFR